MQWLNFKPKGEAMSEIHKGRQEVLALPCKIMRENKTKKHLTSARPSGHYEVPVGLFFFFNLDFIWK